ncbi:CaiB/BaiF CoA transferase family protein [Yinghuangia soli]|uniref:CaiB/BaiF CoA transferase family protein n=1 Tax=Yinghuangia soli TaxID=2908204 RepID=UPI0027E3375A|nr:CoA transferase [Yinghuangia soli]
MAQQSAEGPLSGTLVLDLATLFAGPLAATILGDFGAEVVKVEHPRHGDPSRRHGHAKNGVGLWWKMLSRNKKTVTCDLSTDEGSALVRRLAEQADVLIENFRPGTLERWGLSPEVLHAANPGLVIARVTGFGQFGPYAGRPGFGTLAEAMSGFAAITGEPDGPPTLPPFGLADGISALTCANAVSMALVERTRSGRGQVIDLAIVEPLLTLLGPQPLWWDQLGVVQERTGNRSVNNAPRNTYRARDGRWLAVSTSSQNIAERVMHLVGHPEVTAEPWFASGAGRARHGDELDAYVGGWIAARDSAEVVAAFEAAQAAVAPVYDIRDVFADPQYQALDSITTVDDDELGPLRMQNVLVRMSRTPGSIRWAGPPAAAHNAEVYGTRLGLTEDDLAGLRAKGVI